MNCICFLPLVVSIFQSRAETNDPGHILLIRHGEKNNKAKSGDVHLSKRGQIRADALARFFYPRYEDSIHKDPLQSLSLPSLHSVVAQSAGGKYASQRKLETAEPISNMGRIPLSVFDQKDITRVCDHLRKESEQGRTTLVVWDHTTISDIANNLLGLDHGTIKWPMDRYDVIWDLDLKSGSLSQICQHLLYGDLWCPLNPIQVYPAVYGMESLINQARQSIPLSQ